MSQTIKTIGIVLNHVKYGEKSIVVTIYTHALGRQSYIVNGVRSSKRKDMLPLLMPLSIIEIEAYNKPRTTLQRIKELHVHTPFATIPFNPVRRAISLFITELLSKSLREEGQDVNTFTFIAKSIQALDEGMPGECNFHLYFMLKLSRMLGFAPDTSNAHMRYFDMLNGIYVDRQPAHSHTIADGDKELWTQLVETSLDTLDDLKLSQTNRQRLIAILEEYYMLHIAGFQGLKSHAILHQLF